MKRINMDLNRNKKFYAKPDNNENLQKMIDDINYLDMINKKEKEGEKKMDNTNNNVKLSPPWDTYYSKIVALFGKDPDITIGEFDSDEMEVKLYVNNTDKATALSKLLPEEVKFGNITVKTTVIPANKEWTPAEVICKALQGNPIYDSTVVADPYKTGSAFTYVMFKKEVIQFYNDNMSDPDGKESVLAQDIAKDIFRNQDGVFYCTAAE